MSVKLHKGKSWKKISELVPNKSPTQCLHRWQKVLDPALVKGPWTEEEDKKVIELVEKYSPEKWSYIASFLPGRIGKQCRERWYNHLSPYVKKSNWSKDEEWILWLLHRKLGNKWSIISKELQGRTDNTIKNHWNSTMKKRCKEISEEFENLIIEKSKEEMEKIENEILEECKRKNEETNKIFFEEKLRHYKLFKNSKTNSKNKEWKNILNLRTHSKKVKKRGRKPKKIKNVESMISDSIINSSFKNENKDITNNNKKITRNILSNINNNISNIENEDKENISPNIIKNITPDKNKSEKFDSPHKKSSDKKSFFREIGQRSAFSSSKLHNPFFNVVTPEKSKDIPREKNIRKFEEGNLKTVSFMNTNTNTNVQFASTLDKTRRLKPVKIVSAIEVVDVEDDNMLDKIDENIAESNKSCFCYSPNQKNTCNFCLTNSKEKEILERRHHNSNMLYQNKYNFGLHSQKKNFEGFSVFTPNKLGIPMFNGGSTPGYNKYTDFCENSDRKINLIKFFENIEIGKDINNTPKKDNNNDNLIN